MSAPKVDVLAVMDDTFAEIRAMDGHGSGSLSVAADRLDQARAAVAELIEAAKLATEEKYHDGTSSREACDRLVAALANIGPQS